MLNAPNFIVSAVLLGLVGLGFAVLTYVREVRQPVGEGSLVAISNDIHEGTMVFLKRGYMILSLVIGLMALAIYLGLPGGSKTAASFLFGVLCSLLTGFLGAKAAIRAHVRTFEAARAHGPQKALRVAFSGSAVMGVSVASLGLIGVGALLYTYTQSSSLLLAEAPAVMIGFALGASSAAWFTRVGGGIYTTAVHVSVDLVSKLEAAIPKEDPRNPALLADSVGRSAGDITGMGADLFESYVVSIVASMAIAAATPLPGNKLIWMGLPLIIAALGMLSSLVGIAAVHLLRNVNPLTMLRGAPVMAAPLLLGGSLGVVITLKLDLPESPVYYGPFWAVLSGAAVGWMASYFGEYSTSRRPIMAVARASTTGPPASMITGLALGMKSTLLPVLGICLAVSIAYTVAGLYGIGISAVGMVATAPLIALLGVYGSIGRGAREMGERSRMSHENRKIMEGLDALGNTTGSMCKGFAVASAALAALALFSAYKGAAKITGINLTDARIIVALLIGGAFPFLIAASTMSSVGKTALKIAEEVRRQFREIKGLAEGEGKAKPDTVRCITLSTATALREVVGPGLSAGFVPLVVGSLFGLEVLGGMLAGVLVSGLMLALLTATAGGAWKSAKNYIEKGNFGGRGSDAYKAASIGSAVGDLFQGVTGPSMHVLVKLMLVISLMMTSMLGAGIL